jgi:hypothetical protein
VAVRRSGIATAVLFKHAQKHANLQKYLGQGLRRALTRSAGEAQRTKTRKIISTFNLRDTPYASVRPVRALFSNLVRRDTLTEQVRGPAGIPVKRFAVEQNEAGLLFSIRPGKVERIRGGFIVDRLGQHGFSRKTNQRLPLRKRFGPGIPTMADQPEIRAAGAEAFQGRAEKEIRDEEARAFKRAGL